MVIGVYLAFPDMPVKNLETFYFAPAARLSHRIRDSLAANDWRTTDLSRSGLVYWYVCIYIYVCMYAASPLD